MSHRQPIAPSRRAAGLFATVVLIASATLWACSDDRPELDEETTAAILAQVTSSGQETGRDRTPPPFTVASRIAHLEEVDWFPCSDCHDEQDPNPNVRNLRREHDDIPTGHGGDRFWCLACHHPEDKDHLVALDGSKVSFDDSYKVCGGCHFEQERDFLFGVHGRRIGNWLGDRHYLTCVECHNPHAPAIAPRAPLPPPRIRIGLDYEPPPPHGDPKPWISVIHHRVSHYGAEFMEKAEGTP